MEISELKKAVHKDLTEKIEQERLERIEKNKNLKEVTIYTIKDHPLTKNSLEFYKSEGIKFIEKPLDTHIKSIVGTHTSQVIAINDTYAVHGREYQNAKQAVNVIQFYADPNFTMPSFEVRMEQSIRNLSFGINKSLQSLSKEIKPILSILQEAAKEENEEKNN